MHANKQLFKSKLFNIFDYDMTKLAKFTGWKKEK